MARLEDALQGAVIKALQLTLTAESWYSSIPNGAVLAGDGRARARQGAKMKWMGLRGGAPDLFVVNRGRFLAIELKVGKGKQGLSQIIAQGDIQDAGAPYAVCRSIDEVLAFLRAHGVPMRARVM